MNTFPGNNRRYFLQTLAATATLPLVGAASASASTTRSLDAKNIQAAIDEAHSAVKSVKDGKNADYIPYLAKVPSGLFGIVAVTPDGRTYKAGDTDYAFAIESISKLFTLSVAMADVGPDAVRAKIGASPTGLPFNSVEAIELHQGRPLNPFVNAGAIATTSLLKATSPDERWQKIIGQMSAFAGRALSVNQDVYKSESDTNEHNRGIAWLLKSYGYLYSDPTEATDIYTRQCSVAVTTEDLGMMGGVLAAGGVHPKTGQRLVAEDHVPRMLAEMALNGMYDGSGDWLYNVGLPAKSGVGGGVLAIAPGELAIAAFSPPLDPLGNSVRAQRAIAMIAEKLKLSILA